MLAGSMELRTFVVVVGVAGAGAIVAGYLACSKHEASHAPPVPPAATSVDAAVMKALDAAAPIAAVAPIDSGAAVPPSDLPARPYDADVLAWRTKTDPHGKAKDVSPGAAYTLDVYEDAGQATVDRAKLDANRTGTWDDKYSFDGDKITLEHAPADDETYTDTYHWNGTGWTRGH